MVLQKKSLSWRGLRFVRERRDRVMEGLIPYIIDAMRKKQKADHSNTNILTHSYSNTSQRSYHMLLGSDSFNGSHHNHTIMNLTAPTTSSYAATNLRHRKSWFMYQTTIISYILSSLICLIPFWISNFCHSIPNFGILCFNNCFGLTFQNSIHNINCISFPHI